MRRRTPERDNSTSRSDKIWLLGLVIAALTLGRKRPEPTASPTTTRRTDWFWALVFPVAFVAFLGVLSLGLVFWPISHTPMSTQAAFDRTARKNTISDARLQLKLDANGPVPGEDPETAREDRIDMVAVVCAEAAVVPWKGLPADVSQFLRQECPYAVGLHPLLVDHS